MEKSKFTYDLEYIKYKHSISCLAQLSEKTFISGDYHGKIIIWDCETGKASSYINTSLQEKITQISISSVSNKLFFSQGNRIKSVDLKVIKLLYNDKDINTEYTYESSVDDFAISESEKFIITNDQDNDIYLILNRSNGGNPKVETQSISNVFGQVILPELKPKTNAKGESKTKVKINKKEKDEEFDSLFDSLNLCLPNEKETNKERNQEGEGVNKCIFITFDGRLIKYDLDNNKFLNEKNINNYINKEVYNQYLTNPPYVSCYFLKNDFLSLGLMNGIIITFRYLSLKKESIRTIHESAVIKINEFNNDLNISLGKDNKIKVHRNFEEIIFTIDLSVVYTTKFIPIDFTSVGSRIVLCDNLKDSIKLIKIKN